MLDQIVKKMAQAAWDAGHQAFVNAGSPEAFKACALACIGEVTRAQRIEAAVNRLHHDPQQMKLVGPLVQRFWQSGAAGFTDDELAKLERAANDAVPF